MITILICAVVILVLVWFLIKWRQVKNFWFERGVPHYSPHPIVGSLTFLQRQNPAIWMKQVYNEFNSPYVGMWAFWRPGLVINCPELARKVLVKDHEVFKNRFLSSGKTDPIGGLNLFTVNDPTWSFLRRRLTVLFTAARLRSLNNLLTDKAADLVWRIKDEMKNQEPPNLRDRLYQELLEAKEKNGNKDLDATTLAELTYINCVIKEALRKFPSMGWLDRIASQDYQIDEKLTIPKGTVVYVNAVGMQQDPKHFPKPQEYDPDRFLPENERNITPYTFLPFGEGPRGCIGKRFGYQTVRCGLAAIILNYEVRALPNTPKPNDCHIEKNGLFLGPDEKLAVEFIPRN